MYKKGAILICVYDKSHVYRCVLDTCKRENMSKIIISISFIISVFFIPYHINLIQLNKVIQNKYLVILCCGNMVTIVTVVTIVTIVTMVTIVTIVTMVMTVTMVTMLMLSHL